MNRVFAKWCLGLLLLVAALVVHFSPYPYAAQDRDAILGESTHEHFAGTDEYGRDRAVRSSVALLLGVTGASAAAAVTVAIAAGIGTLAAFSSPLLRGTLLLVSDAFLSLPWLFLLMLVRSGLSLTTSPIHSAVISFALLAVLGWPACARAVYQGTCTLRTSSSMLHGRASGLRPTQLIRLHVLPNLRPLLLPQFFLCIPAYIMAEANLGALGLGVAEPLPSWGGLLLELQNSALLVRSHWVYLPIMLLVTVLLLLDQFAVERSQ